VKESSTRWNFFREPILVGIRQKEGGEGAPEPREESLSFELVSKARINMEWAIYKVNQGGTAGKTRPCKRDGFYFFFNQ